MVVEWVAAGVVCGIICIHVAYLDRRYAQLIGRFEENSRIVEEEIVQEDSLEDGTNEGRIPEEGIYQLAAMSSKMEVDRSSSRRAIIVAIVCLAGIIGLGAMGTTMLESIMLLTVCIIPTGMLCYHLKNVSTGFAKERS